jgi:hypothetical protein
VVRQLGMRVRLVRAGVGRGAGRGVGVHQCAGQRRDRVQQRVLSAKPTSAATATAGSWVSGRGLTSRSTAIAAVSTEEAATTSTMNTPARSSARPKP